jgi:hypothetical protein
VSSLGAKLNWAPMDRVSLIHAGLTCPDPAGLRIVSPVVADRLVQLLQDLSAHEKGE